jgi:hypothetical protein
VSIKTRIADGQGGGYSAGVTQDHALKVSVVNRTASDTTVEELTRIKLLRDFLKSGSSINLNVDGSTTPVIFSHQAALGFAKWVQGVRFLFHDVNMELDTNDFRRFGTAAITPGLINGIKFYVEQGGTTTNFFVSPIQTIGDFMSYADDYTNFVNSIDTQTDFLSFDFNFDVPVALPDGSTDRVVVEIQDDLSSLTLFNVIVRGYQELL